MPEFSMPPPRARNFRTVFTHTETVAGHPLEWVTFTTATYVQITIPHSEEEEWLANVFRPGQSPWPPLLRWNWRHTDWLGVHDSDPTGSEERAHLTAVGQRLWKTANNVR